MANKTKKEADRRKLTESILNKLTAQEKRYKVWDTVNPGLLVEVMPTGRKVFRLYYRQSGKVKWAVIGQYGSITLSQARDQAKKLSGKTADGIDLVKEKRAKAKKAIQNKHIILRHFIEHKYKPWVLANRKSGMRTIDTIYRYFDDLLDKRMDEITQWQMTKWQTQEKKRGLKESTINRNLTALRGILTKAVEWDVLPTTPLSKVKNLKIISDDRIRYLDNDEESRLLNALKERQTEGVTGRESANEWRESRGYEQWSEIEGYIDHLEPIVILALNTGMRRGEIFQLVWGNVDFNKRIVTVSAATAKSSKTRHIPLNDEAFNILSEWKNQVKHSKDNLVFPNPQTGKPLTTIKTSWKVLMTKAKILEFRFHDCRHTFASKLVMAGIDLNTVRELLGHGDIKMTLRYAHLAPEHKAQAVALLNTGTR